MKKILIGALVATIITFIWHAMSWMVPIMHQDSMKYHPDQDVVLEKLGEHFTEDGLYMLPNLPADQRGSSAEQEFWEERMGTPFVKVEWHSSMEQNMGMNMLRDFIYRYIALMMVALVLWYGRSGMKTFGQRWMAAFAFAIFVMFNDQLSYMIWMETPWHFVSGNIMDNLIAQGLSGLWLAWYVKE